MHYDIQRQVLWLQEETKEHMIQQFIESHIIEKKIVLWMKKIYPFYGNLI